MCIKYGTTCSKCGTTLAYKTMFHAPLGGWKTPTAALNRSLPANRPVLSDRALLSVRVVNMARCVINMTQRWRVHPCFTRGFFGGNFSYRAEQVGWCVAVFVLQCVAVFFLEY